MTILAETLTVRAGDARPLGKPDECFYCQAPMGAEHRPECVIPSKLVVVRLTIDTLVSVPISHERDTIEAAYGGELSYCADNTLERLGAWAANKEKPDCACGAVVSAELRGDATDEDMNLPRI